MHNLEGMPDPEGMLADMMGGMLHDVAPRFECLLLLLWYGAALNHQQLTDLLPVLESYGPQCIVRADTPNIFVSASREMCDYIPHMAKLSLLRSCPFVDSLFDMVPIMIFCSNSWH